MTTTNDVHTLIDRAAKAHGAGEAMQYAQAACNAANALAAVTRLPIPATAPAPDVEAIVQRFLSWSLPLNFSPDGGIIFAAHEHHMAHWPTGTNLLDYAQAEAMVRHILGLDPA